MVSSSRRIGSSETRKTGSATPETGKVDRKRGSVTLRIGSQKNGSEAKLRAAVSAPSWVGCCRAAAPVAVGQVMSGVASSQPQRRPQWSRGLQRSRRRQQGGSLIS